MTTNTYILINKKSGEQRIVRAAGKGKALKYVRGEITAFKANVDEVLELIDRGVAVEVAGDLDAGPNVDKRLYVDKRQVDFINDGSLLKAGA